MPEEPAKVSASFHLLAFIIFFLFYQIAQEANSCHREEVQILETILDSKCFSKCWAGGEYQSFETEFLCELSCTPKYALDTYDHIPVASDPTDLSRFLGKSRFQCTVLPLDCPLAPGAR